MKAARPFGFVDPSVFDELVQECYVRLCADNFKPLRTARKGQTHSLFALIQSVAYATAVDYFRRELADKRGGGQAPVSLDRLMAEVASESGSPGNALETSLLLDQVDSILNEVLPSESRTRDRSAFWLYFRQGFSAAEIAKLPAIGLTVRGVESLLQRAVREVRARLKSGGSH